MLAVLPRAGRPRQIDREHERHHVRVRRPTHRVAHFGAPVRLPRLARELGLGRRDRLLGLREPHFGLRVEIGETCFVRQPREVGSLAGRTLGLGADVARERDPRAP